MSRFYPLEVAEVRRETPDCVRIRFKVPRELASTFRYIQGQHLVLRRRLDGEELRRTYSICASVAEARLEIAVKRQPGGRMSGWLNERLRPGEVIEVMPPQGRFFTPLDPEAKRLYVAFAAGSGITPIFSILKTTLEVERQSRFLLFYGNRDVRSIIFREELEDLRDRHLGRFLLYHLLSREQADGAFSGRITPEKVRSWAGRLFDPAEVDAWFLCGPAPMIGVLADTLEALGVAKERIHFEYFTPEGNRPRPAPAVAGSAPAGGEAEVLLLLDGREHRLAMQIGAETILEAALRHGIELPYSCTAGVCATCRARLLEGEVEMAANYALEEEEVAAGHVLTCQARPLSHRIRLDFDVF